MVSFYVPPLRKRKEDIPLLARHFLKKYRTSRREIEDISEAALDYLTSYDWPGNVRELENAIERAVVLTKDSLIQAEDLALSTHGLARDKGISLPSKSLWEVESYLIKSVLEETGWNLKKAAQILRISRTTLYSKINKHKIQRYCSK